MLAGDPWRRSALLQWYRDDQPVAAVSVNHRMPVVKLKKLGAHAAWERPTSDALWQKGFSGHERRAG